jgi:hypothetical protein
MSVDKTSAVNVSHAFQNPWGLATAGALIPVRTMPVAQELGSKNTIIDELWPFK